MSKHRISLEIVVTTMNQCDTKKYREMNLQTDAIIANQTDRNAYSEDYESGHLVKMISTKTRGLSRNRNIGITLTTADLIVFADDDLVFVDGYEELILRGFSEHPNADAILFDMKVVAISEEKKVEYSKTSNDFRPASRRELSRFGVCGLVIRKEVLRKHSLYFNETFGSGTENYCGEDTIFLQDMLNKKINLFLSPIVIAEIDKSNSTWFDGFNENRFYVNGKILAAIYPYMARLIAIRSSYKFSKRQNNIGFIGILRCYWKGIRDYLQNLE